MQEMKAAYKTAIENNDYESFKTMKSDAMMKMKEKHDGKKMMKKEEGTYKEFSEEDHEKRMKEGFDKAVAYYQANGEHMQHT